MQSSTWLLVAIAALAASSPSVDAMRGASAVFLASTSQCSSVKTCFEGGSSSVPCTVSGGGCPPCVTFGDDGCYVKVNGACPFGTDCASFFYSRTRSNVSSTIDDATTDLGSSSSSTVAEAASVSSSRVSAGGKSVDTNSDSGGSDTVMVVAIIAVALGVAIVALAVRRLFLRARASSDENREDEGVPSPPPTEMTASFSSDGTSRYARGVTIVTRSAMGTDLSASKTSTA